MAGPINPRVVSFLAPTQYVDNSPIPAGGIARYEYGFAQNVAGPFSRLVADVDFTPDADGRQTGDINLTGFAFGQWYAAGRAVSSDGAVSAWSNVAPFEVQPKHPNAPTSFSIA
jgi:hypothetical protein